MLLALHFPFPLGVDFNLLYCFENPSWANEAVEGKNGKNSGEMGLTGEMKPWASLKNEAEDGI
jgi:hypothetical protein